MQKHVKKQGSVCKTVQKFKLGMQKHVKIKGTVCKTEAQTRRAGPRVPPKGNTHRKASNEAQTVGTDVLGCPNL